MMRQREENKGFIGRLDSEDKGKETGVSREHIDWDMDQKLVQGKKEGKLAGQQKAPIDQLMLSHLMNSWPTQQEMPERTICFQESRAG